MRCGGLSARPVRNAPGERRFSPQTRASNRSRERARCEPRLSSATAWISSTMTVRTRGDVARFAGGEQDVEDSGVVTRMCGGCEHGAALGRERVAGAYAGADRRAEIAAFEGEPLYLRSGPSRFFWMSLESALSGET